MVSANTDPPSSFHYEFSDEWAIWVLDHGLPELPAELGDDDDVPIAYWAGPRCGSVLFRSWYEDCEPSEEPAAEREVNTEHYSYWRTSDGWEPTGGGGGTGGPQTDPLAPIDLPDDFARLGGGFVENGVAGRTGLVGRSARMIELSVDGEITRRPVESPLGDFVVCYELANETRIRIRILESNDRPLLEQDINSPWT